MAEEEPQQPSLELPALFQRRGRSDSSHPPVLDTDPDPEPEPRAPAAPQRPPRGLPTLAPLPAAVATGVLVGALGVALTWLGLQGCAGLRGTSTCGDPGLLLVVVILAAMTLAGLTLLRALRVAQAGSTTGLGTALVAVLALLLPEASFESTWLLVAVPVAGALTFAAAYLLTSTNTQPGDRPR